MIAIDECEPQIIRAFQKAGWQLHQKPYVLRVRKRIFKADLSFSQSLKEQPQLNYCD